MTTDQVVLIEEDTTFQNCPACKAQWKLQCMLVDIENAWNTLAMYDLQKGGQGMAMNKLALIKADIKEAIELLDEQAKKEGVANV